MVKYKQLVYVMSNLPTPILLGMDFFNSQKAMLDCKKKIMKLRNISTTISIITTKQNTKNNSRMKLLCMELAIIPARSAVWVETQTWNDLGMTHATGILAYATTAHGHQPGLLVNNSIVRITNGKSIIPVTNFTNKPMTIRCSLHLADAFVYDEQQLSLIDAQPQRSIDELEDILTNNINNICCLNTIVSSPENISTVPTSSPISSSSTSDTYSSSPMQIDYTNNN